MTPDPHAWAAPPPRGFRRFVPVLRWLPGYDRGLLRPDVVAGLTVWGLLVPESLAYAGLAGMPPQAGLYTLLATLAAYAVFGTSRHLICGPTSAAAVLLASSVSALGHNGAGYAADAALLVLLAGGFFLLAGVLRLGFIAQFLSRPVVECFVFGLAIYVTIKQLPKLFGIEAGGGDSIAQLVHVITHVGDAHGPTVAVGAAALVLLFAAERFAPRLPAGLLLLVGGIAVSGLLNLSSHGVAVVGHVPRGLPTPSVPDVSADDVVALLLAASGMALVIFSESLGTANTFALEHGYDVDANQELIALGVANAGSGVLGGLAAGGSLSQSAVNVRGGARSEASALVAAVLILLTVLVLTPVFRNLPEAVLGALIVFAVSHLIRVRPLRRLYRERRVEFGLGLATVLGVITINVLPGLVIGIVAMQLVVIYQASRPRLAELGRYPGEAGAFGAIERHPECVRVPGVLVLRLEAPLLYSNATPVRDDVKRLVGAADPAPRAVVLEIGANDDLDVTSAEVLRELVKTLHDAGIAFALADVRDQVVARARRTGLLATIGESRVVHTIDEAIAAVGSGS